MKTYTAANDAEAKALHNGTQTLIVVPMEPQPKGRAFHVAAGVFGEEEESNDPTGTA